MSDAAFLKAAKGLRLDLIKLQQKLRATDRRPAIIILGGVRGAGVIDALNMLNTWMDPRWIETQAFDGPTDEERERPPFWRYWRSLPRAGTMGLYLEGWYGDLLGLDPSHPAASETRDSRLRHITDLERTLADDGALILKLWLHVSEEHQKIRNKEHNGKDPIFGLRPPDHVWRTQPPYRVYCGVAQDIITKTDARHARWHIIPGQDVNRRRFMILDALRSALKRHLKGGGKPSTRSTKGSKAPRKGILASLDLTKGMSQKDYSAAFHVQQQRLYKAQHAAYDAKIPTVLAFEGWDAAGKGGAIRRLTYALNAYHYKVIPISAPTEEELARHYLWRFWRVLGRAGHLTIFDRSWYGRVLVERVDNLAPRAAWQRAYEEINSFEEQLAASGIVLLKFWLHISEEEQLARFRGRAKDPARRWKLTDDDWHNRHLRNAYLKAANEMIHRTSTPHAPWRLVPADSKKFARIAVMDAVATALEQAVAETRNG